MNELPGLIENQKVFQSLVGFPIGSIKESDRNEMAESYIFKSIEELIELRKEFPSMLNPWSKEQKTADFSRIKEELSDVLLFLTNFMIVWKITPEEILSQMIETQKQNFTRLKGKKMDSLDREILSIPGYTSGIGQGNLDAKYVFIGQNPGQEIEHGYRFWSNSEDGSSKVLLPILEKLEIIDDCYLTNFVKSTTPDNKEPNLDAEDFWKDYLVKELEIILANNSDAKIIAMGKKTQDMMSRIAGNFIGIPHPATVIYGGLTKEQYEEEVKEIL